MPFDEDWSPRGVTTVKNQGACTGAWAFTAAAALEGLAILTKGVAYNFSAQHLIDCSTEYGNQGCSGGDPINAFWYVKDNGIATLEKYPYVGQQQTCYYTPALKAFEIN